MVIPAHGGIGGFIIIHSIDMVAANIGVVKQRRYTLAAGGEGYAVIKAHDIVRHYVHIAARWQAVNIVDPILGVENDIVLNQYVVARNAGIASLLKPPIGGSSQPRKRL